jgi:hypothetical protein
LNSLTFDEYSRIQSIDHTITQTFRYQHIPGGHQILFVFNGQKTDLSQVNKIQEMCEKLGVTYNLYDIASEGGIDLLENSQRGTSLA